MKVIVISKESFNVIEYSDVSNIAYASKVYTLTYGSGSTVTYNEDDYRVSIIW